MKEIVYSSFFSDDEFVSLKHLSLFFDKIVLPSHNFVITYEGNNGKQEIEYINMIPEKVYTNFDPLIKEGVVEIQDFRKNQFGDVKYFLNLYEKSIDSDFFRSFSKEDYEPVLKLLKIDTLNEEMFNTVAHTALFLASISIGTITSGRRAPCIESKIINALVNLGLENIFKIKKETDLAVNDELRKLREVLLAQKLLQIYLPKFHLKSSHDILELRENLKSEIFQFHEFLAELTQRHDYLPWEPSFETNLNNLVENRIKPEINDLQKRIKFSSSHNVKKLLKKGGSLFSFSIAIHNTFPTLSQELIAGGSVIGLLGSIVNDQIKREKKILGSHPLSILIDL